MTNEPIAYYCEPKILERLSTVKHGLYGDGSILTPDARRDLAQILSWAIGEMERLPLHEDHAAQDGLAAIAPDLLHIMAAIYELATNPHLSTDKIILRVKEEALNALHAAGKGKKP